MELLITSVKNTSFQDVDPLPLCALLYGGDFMGDPWCFWLCCWLTQKIFWGLIMTQWQSLEIVL